MLGLGEREPSMSTHYVCIIDRHFTSFRFLVRGVNPSSTPLFHSPFLLAVMPILKVGGMKKTYTNAYVKSRKRKTKHIAKAKI